MHPLLSLFFFFFFNDTATTEIYTLSLHDALPIYNIRMADVRYSADSDVDRSGCPRGGVRIGQASTTQSGYLDDQIADAGKGDAVYYRSEEHTSELQSRSDLVCRLLLEKKKQKIIYLLAEVAGVTILATGESAAKR